MTVSRETSRPRFHPDVPELQVFGRQEFLDERWSYAPDGPHITVVGPTRCGKSWLARQLMDRIISPEHPGLWLMKKPRDPGVARWARQLGLRRASSWPPITPPWIARPRGWIVWPRTRFDPDIDRPHKSDVFRRVLMDSYKRGRRLIFVDDAYGIGQVLKLNDVLIELWTEFGSMDGGLMTSFQKPSHVPLWAYNQAEHLFLFHDPDKRSRERFGEIGGVDPKLIERAVMNLDRHQILYVRRLGPKLCIIDP